MPDLELCMNDISGDRIDPELEAILESGDGIPILFAPVVDIVSGQIHGYRIHLGDGEEESPQLRRCRRQADEAGQASAFELHLLKRILAAIADFAPAAPALNFFLPVPPMTFREPSSLLGIWRTTFPDPHKLVLEYPETESPYGGGMESPDLAPLLDLGFRILLSDIGRGACNLSRLLAHPPHYFMPSTRMIRHINRHPEKQRNMQALLGIAGSFNAWVVAEGVSSKKEMTTLARMGVRFAEGEYFGTPADSPVELEGMVRHKILRQGGKLAKKNPTAAAIQDMVLHPPTFPVKSTTIRELDQFFQKNLDVDHVIVLDGAHPHALVTRQHYSRQASGQYGYFLIQKSFIEDIANPDPLIMNQSTPVGILGRRAVERPYDTLYDPILLVDDEGGYVGSVTMKLLLSRFIALEIELASNANPLTGLPGNQLIRQWIDESMAVPPYTIVYADLDHFKEFNDRYGFTQGDEMIRCAAAVLSDLAEAIPAEARIGHVGGDDFILVAGGPVPDSILESACRDFDKRKRPLFSEEDFAANEYEVQNRQGEFVRIPLCTMSLAIITEHNVPADAHPACLGEVAASLKKKAKQSTHALRKSGHVRDLRQLDTCRRGTV